jgi:hypothetical protein
MSDPKDEILSISLAKLSLLEQLVRLLLRERAAANNQTDADIREWAEDAKRFFEQRMPPGTAESYMTAAVDAFFAVLANDVVQDRRGAGSE